MADQREPLLYLVHRIPFPPNKGDKVRSYNILRQLARRYRVYLGTFIDQPEDRAYVDTLKRWCEEVFALEIEPKRRRLASLRALLDGRSLSEVYYQNAQLTQWVARTIAREGVSKAVAFSGPMAQYFAGHGLARRIIDFCDVDSAKWRQYSADRSWPMSWLYRREGVRLGAFECSAANEADSVLFATEAEALLFRDGGGDPRADVRVMQNGVDAEYFSPRHELENPYHQTGVNLVFTGAMDYWPNIDAVTWFVKEILPGVRVRFPGARFWIVGMNPVPAVKALASDAVMVTGTVPDVRPYLAHADVVCASLRIARGIQNKVLEAMAMARPVVLSEAPATGLAAVRGVDCEVADSAREFVESVCRLLENRAMSEALGRAGRECVLRHYSWQAHLAVLDELLDPSPCKVAVHA